MGVLRKLVAAVHRAASLGVAALIGYLAFLLVAWLLEQVGQVDKTIVAAFIAALTAVFGYWYTQRQSKSRDIAESHRPEKVHLYRTFMDILERFLKPNIAGDRQEIDVDNLPQDLQDMFFEFNRGLIVWGSPRMIKTWLRFRRGTSQPAPPKRPLLLMDDVLRQIRKDLGNSNFGLRNGDLVKIFLKDPEELDRLMRAP